MRECQWQEIANKESSVCWSGVKRELFRFAQMSPFGPCKQLADSGHIALTADREGTTMRNYSIITLSTMFLLPMSSAIGDDVVQIDKSGKGAVLCVWAIYQAASAVGLECHKGEDVAFQNELKRSLDRMDDFIIRNSKRPVSKADLGSRRSEGLRQLRSSGNICIGDAAKLYSALEKAGATSLQSQTTDLLSIPREPIMNPCL